MIKSKMLSGILMTILLLSGCQTITREGNGIGVVFMHGRGASDPMNGGVGTLVRSMESYGVTVIAPRMQWAGSYGEPKFSGSMEDALALVKDAVTELKSRGMTTIVIGGMSAGGSSAIGMATKLKGIAGVMAIAPAPPVDFFFLKPDHPLVKKMASANPPKKQRKRGAAARKRIRERINRVKALIASGKGDKKAIFGERNTNNQGMYQFNIETTPNIYFSYIDPEGMRAMSVNALRLNPKTALLWVNDNQGIVRRLGRSYAFDLAPSNPKNRYEELDVLHLEAPAASREIVKQWLLNLTPNPKKAAPKSSN